MPPRPELPLGRFLYDKYREIDLSLAAFARHIGISQASLKGLLHDGLPVRRTYNKLREKYGDDLPATEMAEVQRTIRMRSEPVVRAAKAGSARPEVIKRIADKNRGQKRTPDQIARMIAGRSPEVLEKQRQRFRDLHKTTKGQVMRSLGQRMSSTKTKEPTSAQLEEWAPAIAEQLREPILVVRAHLNVWGRPRGIVTGGSPADVIHLQICVLSREISQLTWAEILPKEHGGSFTSPKSIRVAHFNWHKRTPDAPPCRP